MDLWMYKYAPGHRPAFSEFLSWTGIADHPTLPHTIVLYNATFVERVGDCIPAGTTLSTVLFDVSRSRLKLDNGIAVELQCDPRSVRVQKLARVAVEDPELRLVEDPAAEIEHTLCQDALACELFDHYSMRDLGMPHCVEFVDSIACYDGHVLGAGTAIKSLVFFADLGRFAWSDPLDDSVCVLDVAVQPAVVYDAGLDSDSDGTSGSVETIDSY
jgi:hypothetical protein